MALILVEFVGHHRIGGRLVQRWDCDGSGRLTDRGLVVEDGDTVKTIPWHAIHAVVESRREREEKREEKKGK